MIRTSARASTSVLRTGLSPSLLASISPTSQSIQSRSAWPVDVIHYVDHHRSHRLGRTSNGTLRGYATKRDVPGLDYLKLTRIPSHIYVNNVDEANAELERLQSSRVSLTWEMDYTYGRYNSRPKVTNLAIINLADDDGVLTLHLSQMDLSSGLPYRLVDILENDQIVKQGPSLLIFCDRLRKQWPHVRPMSLADFKLQSADLEKHQLMGDESNMSGNDILVRLVHRHLHLSLAATVLGLLELEGNLSRRQFELGHMINNTWASHLLGLKLDQVMNAQILAIDPNLSLQDVIILGDAMRQIWTLNWDDIED